MLPILLACAPVTAPLPSPGGGAGTAWEQTDEEREARVEMVSQQLAARDITDPLVLAAMGMVPRAAFVPPAMRAYAYLDRPLPIGAEQTISQPYVVARMTQALAVGPGDRVLEVGTGSGYQAAVLAEMGVEVWSIEIVPALSEGARRSLAATGHLERVHLRVGDGYRGWPEEAPFDAVVVTAAPDHVPPPLVEQLAPGGRLVIPVGDGVQSLLRITRGADGRLVREDLLPVMFVPMTGEALRPGPERPD